MRIGIKSTSTPGVEARASMTGYTENFSISGTATDWGFIHPNWYLQWERCLLPDRDWRGPIRFLQASAHPGGVVAVLPLARQLKGPITFWSLGGNYEPFRGFPSDCRNPERTASAVAEAIESFADIRALRMGPVRADDSAVMALCALLDRRGWSVHRSTLGLTFEVAPGPDWNEYFSGLGTGLRRSIRYDEKALKKLGEYRVAHFGERGAPLGREVVSDLATIESASWLASRGGTARFTSAKQQAFWTEIFLDPGLSRHCHVWIMYSSGNPISFCFAIDAGRSRYIVANNYSEKFSKYSTGSILYSAVFRDAIEVRGISLINIGLGDSGYKQRWGAKPSFELADIVAFRPGVVGRVLDGAYWLREKATSLRKPGMRPANPS